MSRARLRPAAPAFAALTLATVALGGCVSLFPKQVPAQLYRFGVPEGAAAATPGPDDDLARTPVISPPVAVVPAGATDRLLTITGSQAAFVGGARWISPAAELWDQAARRAFAARATHVRLLTRSEFAGGVAFLRLDVPEFEARYAAPDAPPTVHVALHALFTHRNGTFSGEHTFVADVPAAENRVGPIVAAYDGAVAQVLDAAVTWADAHADAAASEPPSTAGAAFPGAAVRSTSTTRTTSSTSVQVPPRR